METRIDHDEVYPEPRLWDAGNQILEYCILGAGDRTSQLSNYCISLYMKDGLFANIALKNSPK